MNNDGFLLKLDKMLAASKDKGSVTITMKRNIEPSGENWKPGTSQKRKIVEQEKNNLLNDPQKTFPVLFHSKVNKEKASTEVLNNKIFSFSNSLVNIFRLNCFKNVPGVVKKIKKPTPKNPNSKRSQKLKQKVQLRKVRKLKRNEKNIQRKLQKKDPRKMEIEAK